jgi:hypothetical protein
MFYAIYTWKLFYIIHYNFDVKIISTGPYLLACPRAFEIIGPALVAVAMVVAYYVVVVAVEVLVAVFGSIHSLDIQDCAFTVRLPCKSLVRHV